jgi:hypothetical protein
MTYELLAADWHTGTLLGIVPAGSFEWRDAICDPGEWSCSLDVHEPALAFLAPARTLVYVHDSESREIRWAGIVWRLARHPESDTIEASGSGLFGYLGRRVIRGTYTRTATEQLAIAESLVAVAEGLAGGSLRLTVQRQPQNSGVVRDVTYPAYELTKIGDALAGLAVLDRGFEFRTWAEWSGADIRHMIRFAYPRLGRDLPFVWQDGTDVVVTASEDDRADYANWWRARGTGNEDAAPTVDLGSGTQPVVRGGFPVLETAVTYSDIADTPRLTAKGNADMAASHVETITVALAATTLYPLGSWQLGDSVRIVSASPALTLDGSDWWRIGGYRVAVDDIGHAEITLDVDRYRNNARPVLRPIDRLHNARLDAGRRLALVENMKGTT